MVDKTIEAIEESRNWHWRNSMRPVRFFNVDARAAIPFFFLLMYARLITLIIAILSTLFFWFLERRGLTLPPAIRSFRSWLVGPTRRGWLSKRQRRLRDYG